MKLIRKFTKRILFNIGFDVGSMFVCLTLLSLIKYHNKMEKLADFNILFGSYVFLILFFSIVFDKFELKKRYGFYKILNKYLYTWVLSTIILLCVVLLYDLDFYRWQYLIVSFVSIFFFEVILISIRFSYRYAKFVGERFELKHFVLIRNSFQDEISSEEIVSPRSGRQEADFLKDMIPVNAIQNKDIRKLISKYSIEDCKFSVFVNTINRYLFLSYKNNSLDLVVNTYSINYIAYINKFLEIINIKLKKGGKLIICVETLEQRSKRQSKRFPVFVRPFQVWMEFLVHRVWPRLPFFRKLYFWFWKYNSRRISYAETLGRLYSCGFEYVEEIESKGVTWLVLNKKDRPLLSFDVTYSPLIKLRRIGKGGILISVFKMRTMHPYSEFLQDFIYRKNQLSEGGKFSNDFRVTTFGRFMRKTWIDELPMILNLLKGDIKIVGVRPLSRHYFSLYPLEVQKKRIKYKPGLIPPFYVDMPKTLDEIVDSESIYLDRYEKAPLRTDFIYFWKAVWNIVVRRARSE